MKKKMCMLILFLALLVALGIGTAFSATVNLRTLNGSNKIHVEPNTQFQVEVFIDLDDGESVAGYDLYVKLPPLIEFQGNTSGGLYESAGVDPPKKDILRICGFQRNYSSILEDHVVEILDLYCLGSGYFEIFTVKGELATGTGVPLAVNFQGLSYVEIGICGNTICEPNIGEDCLSCPNDCAGNQKGKLSTRFCCGDGDGYNPVGCDDLRCNSEGYTCNEGPSPVCGDRNCDQGENQCNCPDDCGGPPPETETDCSDGLDNDCDGAIDNYDPDCCSPKGEACTTDSECCSNRCHKGVCK